MVHTIQYLRAIAALMVVWHHARNMLPELKVYFASSSGASGVDVFFVISGFIMVLTTHGKDIGPLQFMKRRVIRVAPPYWLLTGIMIFGALGPTNLFKGTQVHLDTAINSLLFIPHYSKNWSGNIWPILVPGWTLNYEMFFYAVFALSLFVKPSFRLLALIGSFFTLVLAGYILAPLENPLARTYMSPIILEFVYGAIIARLWISGRFKIPLFASGVILMIGAILLVTLEGIGKGLGASLLVAGVLNLANWRSPVLHALGDGSYSIYLTHIFTLGVVRLLWVKFFPGPPTLVEGSAFMLVSLLACASAGWLFYYLVERPMTKSLHARLG